MNDDVLEIGDDGTFEVPSSVLKPIQYGGILMEESSYKDLTSGMSSAQYSDAVHREILSDMNEGHFKVFKKPDSNEIHVIIKLDKESQVSRLMIGKNHIEVRTSQSNVFRIALPDFALDYQSAVASSWEEYLTVKLQTR